MWEAFKKGYRESGGASVPEILGTIVGNAFKAATYTVGVVLVLQIAGVL